MLLEEVRATVSFTGSSVLGNLKRGDRIQVDIHDPVVAGLIRAGYLKIHWKEPSDATQLGDPADPDWVDCLFGSGVDAGAMQEAEAQIDGPGTHRPHEESEPVT